MKIFGIAAALACLLVQPAVASAEARAEQVVVADSAGRMPLVIWSPAGDAGGRPLIVISHGTGAGPLAHVDTAEALAAAGFVVAAPLHRGDNFQNDADVGRPQWMANRARDVSSAIDFMLRQWSGRARIDGGRVGIFGFSAGGTTALISAGGVPDLGRIAPHCAANAEFVCTIMAPPTAEPSPPPRWTHDPRIAAAVVAAPGLGFAFEPSGLANVRVPVQLWAASHDDIVPLATNAAVVQRLLPAPPEFRTAENAVHLSFLAPCTAETPPALCRDREGFDRAAFHRSFNEAVVQFFRRHLAPPAL
jgi:predicted dienelactone hydrolase